MSNGTATNILRPAGSVRKWIGTRAVALIPLGFRLLRRFAPILRLGSTYVVTLYDDVLEVFRDDRVYSAPYWGKLRVITGDEPFFLGMNDTAEYRAGLEAMQRVVRAEDLPALAKRSEELAREAVKNAGGEIEVVQLVRDVTFTMLSEYFGVSEPAGASLQLWATRLFEFQFTDPKNDPDLRAEVDVIAPALRAHVDREIANCKSQPGLRDDVLARCLKMQASGAPNYSDTEIRTAIVCMIVGGPPQPPMVVPQALEQLLRRPAALKAAQVAARSNDDQQLHNIVMEAMRFDPLAPGLPRTVLRDTVLAKGSRREKAIPKGATVLAAFASAMMDAHRLAEPYRFRPSRPPHEYVHFGYGLHECFGRHINHATLHIMLKPLLQQAGLRRRRGAAGRLLKNGAFAERLVVQFD